MENITKEQIKHIYALGSAVGILDRGNKDDDLHALVSARTGKDSISALSVTEAKNIERDLMDRMRLGNRTEPLDQRKKPSLHKKPDGEKSTTPGMMTNEQQRLAWRMIYRLTELDTRQAGTAATPGERMCGAIRKELGIDVSIKDPMRWVSFDAGQKLIEQLKRYVRSAERSAVKQKEVT